MPIRDHMFVHPGFCGLRCPRFLAPMRRKCGISAIGFDFAADKP
jgi:hypothetical protein